MRIRLPYCLLTLFVCIGFGADAQTSDSTGKSKLPYFYNWTDVYLNRFSYSPSFVLKLTPEKVNTTVLFNPEFSNFSVTEKAENKYDVKTPEALSFNEYSSIQNAMLRRSILRDIERAQDGYTDFSGKRIKPLLETNKIFDKIFGDKLPEFKPNGYIAAGIVLRRQRTDNPTIPIANRDITYFDPDLQMAINFNNLFNGQSGGNRGIGNGGWNSQLPQIPTDVFNDARIQDIQNILKKPGEIREKVNIQGNFDTKSAFMFDNRLKISFKNDPEDILQVVELGNISFPNRSQLIPGIENLLGLKVGLKFGKLDITGVVAQQNSRTKSIILNGGSQGKNFEIRADNYEENRHFFLSQFFRNNYESSLHSLPVISSGAIITRVEVYVTNRTYNVETNRNIVGFNDLGEADPYNKTNITVNTNDPKLSKGQTDNDVNNLGKDVVKNKNFERSVDLVGNALATGDFKMRMGNDFEVLRNAKKLSDDEFELNKELGYISLRTPIRNDEVLAVSYEYTYRGKRYVVGELTEDYVNEDDDKVIMMKLLKSSNIRNNLKNPMWDLMMKNVYSLGQGQLTPDAFQMRVIYKDDKTGMDVPFLADVPNLANKPLLELLGLDNLNYNNERIGDGTQGDGNFDYIEGVTVNSRYGRIIFPVLEPFGSTIVKVLEPQNVDANIKAKYPFTDLYTKTLTDAQQNTLKNKFYLSGTFVLGSADIALPLGASTGSIRVYSGGTELKPGVDFMVDSQMGTIRFMNESIMNSGRTIRVDYEESDMFQTQVRRMFGLRLDYTFNRNLRVGATLQDLRENTTGFSTRTSIGNEPVNNTLWGLDLNYKKDGTGLTKILDALPGIQTKEKSSLMVNAEFAQLIPGVNSKRVGNSSMIDDFEYARNINDVSRQPTRWRLGATPQTEDKRFGDRTGPNTYAYNYKRAKMSVYSVDMTTYFTGSGVGNGAIPPNLTEEARRNPFTANFNIQDILVGRSLPTFAEQVPTSILDISYFPDEPGMYNYNPDLSPEGKLNNPTENFGAITRGITFDADFDNSNVEYIEFWMMNPYADLGKLPISNAPELPKSGKLLLQLGDISEDVIPDSRFNFENGIKPDSLDGIATNYETKNAFTDWGKAPGGQFMIDAFENNQEIRKAQDVGLDGLSSKDELEYVNPNGSGNAGIKGYMEQIRANGVTGAALEKITRDPSKDDFRHFLDESFTQENATFLERYKDYLGMENNSPYNNSANASVVYANSNLADKEDVNQDNTINELESYYQYEIDLKPSGERIISPYIVDSVAVNATADRPGTQWYLFRVPVQNPTSKYEKGEENSFKSVRFMRMVMTEWDNPIVLRFATLQLVSNQYRKYNNVIYDNVIKDNGNEYEETVLSPTDQAYTTLKSSTVSIEENGCPRGVDCSDTKAYPYAVPPGFVRDVNYSTQARMEFNEQSMSLEVDKLRAKESRGVFKNTQLDLNMYKRIKMFVHMHKSENSINVDSAGMFLRIGTDIKNNYYEIEIPKLEETTRGQTSPTLIWPEQNEIDVPLDDLRGLKMRRNQRADTTNFRDVYSELLTGKNGIWGTASGTEAPIQRDYRISVKGNPDLSNIQTIMIGVRNNSREDLSYVIWADELRTFGFDSQDKGSAGLVNVDVKLADIGTLSLSGNFRNFGFGGVQDKISGRAQEDSYSYGAMLNLDLDKFLPMKWGLEIPFFVNYEKQVVTPGFNPLDPDIRLDQALEEGNLNPYQKNLTRDLVSDVSTTSGFNFMNVRKVKTGTNTKSNIWDIENFTFSYAQNRIYRRNVLLAQNDQSFTSAGLTYLYSPKPWAFEPFKNNAKMDSSFFSFLKDFNLSPIPTVISFKAYNEQVFYRTRYRDQQLNDLPDENLIKYFFGNRYYDLQWNLTRSISVTYKAHMRAILDDKNKIPTAEQDTKFGSKLFSLGRAKNYKQEINVTWRLPLQQIYPLDWITANAVYNNHFDFQSVAFNSYDTTVNPSVEFGNIISNGRDFGLDGKVDLLKLYNKFRFLRKANEDNQPRVRYTRAPGDEQDLEEPSGKAMKALLRLLMATRGINARFALTEETVIPGFLPISKFFGMDGRAPGLNFVLGSQKQKYIDRMPGKGWLSESVQQYNPIIQKRGYTFEYSTNFEPFKGLTMVVRGNVARNNNISYVYQPGDDGVFDKFSPVRGGSFKMSFWSFNTSFKKVSSRAVDDYAYEPYQNLVDYREQVIGILKEKYPEIKLDKNSQDVLIPAFFAAYTGKDLDDLFTKNKYTRKGSDTFNPFLGIPMPNWNINYRGLEKVPFFRSIFSTVTLSHSFVSSYSIGEFTSSLLYDNNARDLEMLNFRTKKGSGYNLGYKENDFTNLFDPVYIMSSMVFEERFAPFLGINFTTKGNFSGNFSWNKDRMAMLNLSNAQVSETHGSDFIFGFGIKKNNISLPLKGRDGNNIILKNDLTFRMDFSLRDLKLIQRKLDGDAIIKNGSRSLQIRPNMAYQINKRISMTMYWEKQVNTPYVTQTFYTNNSALGMTARFNLSD